MYIQNMNVSNPLSRVGGGAGGGSGVSETRPLITHNTLIFLRCSYVGSNGSCSLDLCGYAPLSILFYIAIGI